MTFFVLAQPLLTKAHQQDTKGTLGSKWLQSGSKLHSLLLPLNACQETGVDPKGSIYLNMAGSRRRMQPDFSLAQEMDATGWLLTPGCLNATGRAQREEQGT